MLGPVERLAPGERCFVHGKRVLKLFGLAQDVAQVHEVGEPLALVLACGTANGACFPKNAHGPRVELTPEEHVREVEEGGAVRSARRAAALPRDGDLSLGGGERIRLPTCRQHLDHHFQREGFPRLSGEGTVGLSVVGRAVLAAPKELPEKPHVGLLRRCAR